MIVQVQFTYLIYSTDLEMITKSILLLSAAIVLTIGSPVENEARDIESRQAASIYRLNDDVIPVYYILELTPYLDGVRFKNNGNRKLRFNTLILGYICSTLDFYWKSHHQPTCN